ncbi:hypothetical protein EGH24_12165 [Halonotius terrestris]|uniref:Uncharacterized protein n=1 Tax=Halonotius terrestris TaxID=2487750 RepID=A0A8J8PB51_9EURY|nr:hypothetical protein [Halonotius terrestris]TQQ79143.1 hypothetical protein EGH24_12165 [Halonotius terrestris]
MSSSQNLKDDGEDGDQSDVFVATAGRFEGFQNVFNIFLGAIVLCFTAYLIYLILMGQTSSFTLPAAVTGLATVLLVSITYSYSNETKRLVNLNQKRNEREEKRKQEQIENTKRALAEEISHVEDWDETRQYIIEEGYHGSLAPTQIYESDPWRAGQFDEVPREAVYSYYNSLIGLQNELEGVSDEELLTNDVLQRNLKQQLDEISLRQRDALDALGYDDHDDVETDEEVEKATETATN